MDWVATVVGSGIGLASGLVTAYAAMRFKLREERAKREAEQQENVRLRYLDAMAKDRLLSGADPDSRIKSSPAAWIEAQQVARYMLIIQLPGSADKEKFFLMPETRLLVGRSATAGLSIPDALMSREHCFFEVRDGVLYVQDVQTQNGTRVNGQPIDKLTRLKAKDVVMAAETRITVASVGMD